ncbi:MAG: DUF3187 family protein [Pseudomonadota bacterium]
MLLELRCKKQACFSPFPHLLFRALLLSLSHLSFPPFLSSLRRQGSRALNFIWIPIIFLLFVSFSTPLYAKDYNHFGPIGVRIQNPLYLQNLGLTPRRAQTLKKRQLEVYGDSSYSNMFETGMNNNNELWLDMELWRIGFNVNYGLSDDFEVGLELPFYHMWGGFLDGFIEDFHKAFGFPNGGRERFPKNQYHYYYKRRGVDIFNYPSQMFSVGDLKLSLKNKIVDETRLKPLISWFAELKFPTGDEGAGISNGELDFGLGVALQKSYKRFHTYFNAEYIVSGGNSKFGTDVHIQNLAYMIAFELTILPTWSAILQLNGATPLYSGTGMKEFEGVPLDLVVGFRGEEPGLIKGNDLFWQFGFTEDILSDGPSVDFTVFMSLGFRFNSL